MRSLAALATVTLAVFAAAPAAGQERSPVMVETADENLARAIHAALAPREPPETLFQAERLSAEAAERAALFLRAEGYYQAEATPDPLEAPFTARIVVEPGPLFTFDGVRLAYGDDEPAEEAHAAASAALERLRNGAAARSAEVLAAEAEVLTALKAAGYADASMGARRVVVDHATLTMQVTFAPQPGPLVRLGEVRVAQPEALEPGVAERFATWEPGETYSPDAMAELRRGVASSGAFSRVQTELADDADADGARDVVLSVEPAERRTLDLGLSYSTSEGVGAEAVVTRRNLWRRAETVTLEATLAQQRQSIGATAALPRAGPQGQTARYSVTLAREDQGPYNRDAAEAAVAFDAPRVFDFQPSYGASVAADLYSETAGVQNAVVVAAFGEARLDRTDAPLDAREGFDVRLRAEPSVSFGDAATSFLRVTGDARGFFTPERRDWLTLAARTRVGWIEPISGAGDDLPIDRLFYAGGGGSVRGYAFNSIFPDERQRANLAPGGRGLFEVALEARARVSERWGVTTFVDAGNAFDDLEDAGDLRFGAGIGVRYDLGFAPLRVDIAAPLDPRDTDDPVAVYISLGQAF